MNTSVTDHLISQAQATMPEPWGPTAKIAFISVHLCQWWTCLDGPRRGAGEWRIIPSMSRQQAEAEGPVAI